MRSVVKPYAGFLLGSVTVLCAAIWAVEQRVVALSQDQAELADPSWGLVEGLYWPDYHYFAGVIWIDYLSALSP